ncbi:aminotransferase class I/II-fold pyridoxal phosphate-dependent enzyme [Erwinia sorbitola]|uniref:Aminotransferase class I/II-fold pyridoxal phosphate-dependent enzyme n=1 Tax=Erwinia sorbitola TaxID=2681984 RepID=A0A6I6ELN2_9GAMM|nr:aminotransferase class I/II-fold pyridoxal phosphate-dependent enzyme [Erwinia sorbitola]QGU85939.1 aminotransferase class I/II-fold pyridoxal phosphate-dependent enzyme [Erwinia sorbitola]
MMVDEIITVQEDAGFKKEKVSYKNDYLTAVSARIEEFVRNGKMDLIEREFHSPATTSAEVSLSRYSTESPAEKKQVLHLGSYNYSGLNGHPEIINASIDAIKKYGTTSSGVRLLNGTNDLHIELEKRLADFLGMEEAITVSSGYAANLAVLGTLCQAGDIVLTDMLNHQSIVDGLKLSGAKVIPYRHCSLKSIETTLKNYRHVTRKFLVTDGVFSMDGNFAPLVGIVELCERYGVKIIVDDAHGTGHVGPFGKGVCEKLGVTEKIDIIIGSMSKGLPGIGGFIATNSETANILRAAANPYIFSASIPPAVSASVIEAIKILESNPEISRILEEKTYYFSDKLRNLGFDLLNTESSIIPILGRDEDKVFEMTRLLFEKGVYVNPVGYPAVAKSRARIRINLCSSLTYKELDYCIDAIACAGKTVGVI